MSSPGRSRRSGGGAWFTFEADGLIHRHALAVAGAGLPAVWLNRPPIAAVRFG